MKKILFVCSGNVGRSQMAEAYFNSLSKNDRAISAGVDPNTPKKYPVLPMEVIQVMKEDGVDVSNQKVKYVQPKMVNNSDSIYIMCSKDECPKYVQDSDKVIWWNIGDPYGSSIDNFRKIRNQIKAKVLNILS